MTVNKKTVGGLVLLLIINYFLVGFLVNDRFEQLENDTKLSLSEQKSLLVAIAETTARNGADQVTEVIVKDCSMNERGRFDELLGKLDGGLQYDQLVELEKLFGRCGSFFAERKSVMVARLTREIEIYANLVKQLGAITGDEQEDAFLVEDWIRLSEEEQKQSEYFSELVLLQGRIINALLAGESAKSEEMVSILHEVRETNEMLTLTNKQASALRMKLVSL